jgi:hypothetical protein
MAAGSAAKGVAGIMGGFAQRDAYSAQALGAQIERDMALLRGKQIGAQSREQLLTTEGNINTIRATRGASLNSATGQAIRKRTMQDSYRAEGAAVLSELTRASAADQARKGYRRSASWAVPLAVLGSVSDFASAASGVSGMKGGK